VRTAEFQNETYQKILNDSRLTAQDKKGVSSAMHYKSLTPKNFVPPLLHLEIGMVNLVWDSFENWIDNVAEMVPPLEQDARRKLREDEKKFHDASEEKKLADRTLSIEMRQKKAEIATLKKELKQVTQAQPAIRSDLQTRIELLTAFVNGCKDQLDKLKHKVKESQKEVGITKNNLVALKAERGKPEASIVAEMELLLDKHKVSRAAYHGGDFNGVCCRRLVNGCNIIMEEVKKIILAKKDGRCDEMEVMNKVEEIEQLLGLLDAAFAYLNIIYPNDIEKQLAREATDALIGAWRKAQLSMTLKAHVM